MAMAYIGSAYSAAEDKPCMVVACFYVGADYSDKKFILARTLEQAGEYGKARGWTFQSDYEDRWGYEDMSDEKLRTVGFHAILRDRDCEPL